MSKLINGKVTPKSNVAQLVSTLTLATKHNASLVGQVLSNLTDENGKVLVDTANFIYTTSKQGGKDQRINTLNKTIKRVSTKDENLNPLKLAFDRTTKVYSLVDYVSKSSQKSTFDKIVELLSSENCDLTQKEVQQLGKVLAQSIMLEVSAS